MGKCISMIHALAANRNSQVTNQALQLHCPQLVRPPNRKSMLIFGVNPPPSSSPLVTGDFVSASQVPQLILSKVQVAHWMSKYYHSARAIQNVFILILILIFMCARNSLRWQWLYALVTMHIMLYSYITIYDIILTMHLTLTKLRQRLRLNFFETLTLDR